MCRRFFMAIAMSVSLSLQAGILTREELIGVLVYQSGSVGVLVSALSTAPEFRPPNFPFCPHLATRGVALLGVAAMGLRYLYRTSSR